jgi:hypothetical protein
MSGVRDCKSWWKAWRHRRRKQFDRIQAVALEEIYLEIPDLLDFTRRNECLGTRRTRRLARLNVTVKLPARLSGLGKRGASLSFYKRLR